MSLLDTSKAYDAYYYAHGCGEHPYERNEHWLSFFASIADQIATHVQPHSVLDAGCAMGFLVEALRSRGVEAFGVDVSEYAIQQVHPSVRPYCWVGLVTEALPRRYDLIVCIEVLEHVTAAEATSAIANFCQHTDDILFSSSPFDYREATHLNVQPPEYWAELFARHGFFRDVDFDASFITPWAARFRKSRDSVRRVIAAYERRLWQMKQENDARRELNIEQRNQLALKEYALQSVEDIEALKAKIKMWETRWAQLEASAGGRILQKLQTLRGRLAPPGSDRDRMLSAAFHGLLAGRRAPAPLHSQTIQIDSSLPRPPLQSHTSFVEVIVCVHNALADVQRCLESVVRHTSPPFSIVLVDDGSDRETRDYLAAFSEIHGATLIRNEEPKGYARAANQGLRQSSADYVVLLNSDTIVTSGWLDRLIACAESDPRIALVGPLSNTASWQSIPDIESQGDWAANPLPPGMTVDEMGELVAHYSARSYPSMSFLNGFCLLIRQQVLKQIGYFDEDTFGAGYGEEDDYTLRARKAGWSLALADDVYIYHAQSRSYSHEKRKQLSARAGVALASKHGQQVIKEGVEQCQRDRVLQGIRARGRVMFARQEWIEKGRSRFAGRRMLFVLPINSPGGGGNVVIDEGMAMRQMGVEAHLFNLESNRDQFELAYPELEIPVLYGDRKHLLRWAYEYDAVVATYYTTVEWLAPIAIHQGRPVRGYYVQGFEPYFFPTGTEQYRQALSSYSLLSDLTRFTKTEWTRQEVKRHTGVECAPIGISLNIDVFRPRPRSRPEWPDRSVRIAAMVRPNSPYREPKLTMEILRRAAHHYGNRVEVMIFGATPDELLRSRIPQDFDWQLAGVLDQKRVARLLNEADIFVDFSSHQAMGLTALEAMACGAAVIVPRHGGAASFARHEVNSLIVNTASARNCWHALQRLIENHELRLQLQQHALIDVCEYYPERPAFKILDTLFGQRDSRA